MSQLNKATKTKKVSPQLTTTHEGGLAYLPDASTQLRRTVMTCMLWEDNFYEDGESVADRIRNLVPKIPPAEVADIAVKARHEAGLRHVPLLIAREMVRHVTHKPYVAATLEQVITRADQVAEFVQMYWKLNDGGKKMLPRQVKLGISRAVNKFSKHEMLKWNKPNSEVTLRDAIFYAHVKPQDNSRVKWNAAARRALLPDGKEAREAVILSQTVTPFTEQEQLFDLFLNGHLKGGADTWENKLSQGADKRETFERLMTNGKLGGLAFLRNLRGMQEAGVPTSMMSAYSKDVNVNGILPFQFLMAARVVPWFEKELDAMMLRAIEGKERLPGRTLILVDVSGSMDAALTKRDKDAQTALKTEYNKRVDAAAGVAILASALCEDCVIYKFTETPRRVPPRNGMALRDAIGRADGGTRIGHSVLVASQAEQHDRIIVVTDEQSSDKPPKPNRGVKAYLINVGTYAQSVTNGSDGWVSISGWSESVFDYIQAVEELQSD